ncbi:GAF domain-containing protein [Motilibacter peucedani]|uniref:GAF domain-containing protein n=1 Tax=Motilibacter peucedani TaxID=598650 RepID=A0A420XP51_9ACTN|nr:GAF domain-containing protein [Motilibacter peucedani]RKS73979.1 GAF domain-containing protein [Motilibacter peucedani]
MAHEELARRESLALESSAAVVPEVRRWLRRLLVGWGHDDLVDEAELSVSELVGNVVLHAPGPAVVEVASEPQGVRLQVLDTNPALPVRRKASDGGTTGRGLNLLSAVSSSWGAGPRADGRPGKVVWCELGGGVAEPEGPDIDPEALLAMFGDDVEVPGPVGHRVTVGEAPTQLLAAAKDHLDGVLRELALADTTEGGALPHRVVEDIRAAVARFTVARVQIRALLADALEQRLPRVTLRFTLPVELADAGEGYLRALAAADSVAQDKRLLSLESPVEFRVLREWYVEGLVAGLRDAEAGRPVQPAESFEARLLREVRSLDQRYRDSALAAQLQQVTARLAAAETLMDIAEAAVSEGMLALRAAGGTLSRPGGGLTLPILERGVDEGLGARYGFDPNRPAGPSTRAIRTGRAVYVESRDEYDARFPHLVSMQPGALAVAAAPLLVAGEVVGALRFSFPRAHVFSAPERAYLDGLAAQTAQAVARSDALERVREAEERSRSLARLGEALAASRSPAAVLDAVADALVPRYGEWVAVHLVGDHGRVWCPLARRSDDARRAPGTAEVFARFAQDGGSPTVREVMASGATRLVEDLADVPGAGGPGGAGSRQQCIVVPLVSRGGAVGAVSVARPGPHPLPVDDVATVEDVGRRAGVALDNVRTYTVSVRLDQAMQAARIGSFELTVASGELVADELLVVMHDAGWRGTTGTFERFLAAVDPDDVPRLRSAVDTAVSTVGDLVADYRVREGGGSLRRLQVRGRALPGPDGRAERLVGVVLEPATTPVARQR